MRVPFVDLKAQYASIKDEIDTAMGSVVETCRFVGGSPVEEFEGAFARFCDVRYAVGVGNGTDALELALRALGIGPGDEVITVANTFIATAAAIYAVGAKPVLVDIEPSTYMIDPAQIEAAITPKTRAVIPVHLYGQPADMDPILAICRPRGIAVVEDAAQAHGAEYKGRRIGSIGDVACFSFYPGKNLGAYGDGGAITTNDAAIYERVAKLCDHGRISKYEHALVGRNSRLDTLQAAVLTVKLRHLDGWNARRRQVANWYQSALLASDVGTPIVRSNSTHVYHLFVVTCASRDARDGLQAGLTRAGVETGIHYPLPLHLQPAVADLGYRPGDMPFTEEVASRILSLPMFAEMTLEQVNYVADAIQAARSLVA
ncbi:MAG TPA: DegT/DnrJ/EryC1/StrS family aminotransferase [Thermomicrobiaceae bacterium]|nr:DegT/DnrJ/EryC1/StrS family aminotransferase [Thermomicrobiaceae bacterium]